jgi:hypothetical protein
MPDTFYILPLLTPLALVGFNSHWRGWFFWLQRPADMCYHLRDGR